MNDPDVLIVGAGPVGLSLAHVLAANAVRVLVIETMSGPTDESRAAVLQCRTLDLWAKIGLAQTALARGSVHRQIAVLANGRELAVVPVGQSDLCDEFRFPHGLLLEQRATQRMLAERLADYANANLTWNTTLEGVLDNGTGVIAQLRDVSGRSRQVHTPWLIGADGVGSTTRELLGVPFEGHMLQYRGLLADATVSVRPAPDRMEMHLVSDGTIMIIPLPGCAEVRLAAVVPAAYADQLGRGKLEASQWTAVRDYFAPRMPPGVTLHDISDASTARIHARLAARFAKGRCFLVGDAAHSHPPAGGQGLTLGITDAFNLGWKLAAVVHGHADETLLKSYEIERKPIAQRIRRQTERAFGLEIADSFTTQFVRRRLLPPAQRFATAT